MCELVLVSDSALSCFRAGAAKASAYTIVRRSAVLVFAMGGQGRGLDFDVSTVSKWLTALSNAMSINEELKAIRMDSYRFSESARVPAVYVDVRKLAEKRLLANQAPLK